MVEQKDYVSYSVLINGIEVNAVYSRDSIDGIFRPLLRRLTRMQKDKNRRILAFFAAPPGAGKSTLLSFLERLASEDEQSGEIQIIGMDGFHRRQAYLVSHTVIRDGEEMPMSRIKGAPPTFDLEKLTERLKRIAAGENCGWPVYDRRLHDPVDNVITVDGDIVLLEGNYLLLGEPGWRDLRDFADYTVLIRANEDLLRRRLTDRKARGMATREEAEKFVKFSDMRNVRTCLEHSGSADLILEMTGDGEYRVVARKEKKVQGEKPAAVVRIWKAPKGVEARYVTLTECGQLIHAYRKLSDIRKDYRFEIRNNRIRLKRELDHEWPRGTEKTEGKTAMNVYSMRQWKKDGKFNAEPGQEISAEVYDVMRRCMAPLSLTASEYDMEDGFIMVQETGIRDGKPLHMAFGEKGGRCYYLGEEADWK